MMGAGSRKVSLVTGAAGGIGIAISKRLAADGDQVVLNDLAEVNSLDALAAEVGGLPVRADISDPAQVEEMFENVRRQYGPIDVLVANAAHYQMQPFDGRSEQGWWRELTTNLVGTLTLIGAALPEMRRMGKGHIVIISSFWGVTGWPRASGYSASKAGLLSLTRALRTELTGTGVTVGCILPGIIETPAVLDEARDSGVTLEELYELYLTQIPMARIGQPADVAELVSAMTGPDASALSGQMVSVTGGMLRASL